MRFRELVYAWLPACATSSNLLTNDAAMYFASGPSVFRVRPSIHGMNGKPQCRKHIFTSSHFCSLSRSLHSRRPQCDGSTPSLPGGLPRSLAWHVGIVVFFFFLLLQFNSRSAKSCHITNRLDISIESVRSASLSCDDQWPHIR